ncbi:unnamed protein product [Fraxinus pennsylvanica]|uniref:Uncharacterized protein n=1 Tax=Fraxinus pennsylvanica TaxID=56036 RepID=A0AAD1ZPW0_9LAMI|nr:unnamed protein product [Fraxinus pennsylvanica]
MKSFVSFKDKNHSKSGVTSPLANEDELFSGSVIYNIKRLLCIPDTDPAVHQSKYPFLMQSLNTGDMPLIAPLSDRCGFILKYSARVVNTLYSCSRLQLPLSISPSAI